MPYHCMTPEKSEGHTIMVYTSNSTEPDNRHVSISFHTSISIWHRMLRYWILIKIKDGSTYRIFPHFLYIVSKDRKSSYDMIWYLRTCISLDFFHRYILIFRIHIRFNSISGSTLSLRSASGLVLQPTLERFVPKLSSENCNTCCSFT